ncbi:DUF3883 domain-containing protein [Roseiconus lacunae]|uniref:DUF3883 domain-containing protein n=1 Tax=Roseiconus lacunae TaxID=2605694 RepID=UPI00308515CF|nr:DUF3883 domain-containing protein [Stieleria sp. HD01]
MKATPLKFGQRQKLTNRLRELVRKYPKGVGLFKEFLQNADDAGASRLDAVLDLRTHPKNELPNGKMSCLQGRALVFLNDQVFTEEDWAKIQDIGNSGKAMDTAKTGRFGLGFNCVYNVTDFPMLLTDDRLGIFDPHANTVEGASHVDPGAAWTLEDLWENHPDLLAPFLEFGLREGQTQFDGTIFRLPLRDQRMAEKSEVCSEPYMSEDFRQMVESVEHHAGDLILFLNSVRDFKLSKIAADGVHSDFVSVETKNGDEIAGIQSEIHQQVSKPVEDTLTFAELIGDQTWFSEHELEITTRSESRIERWARVRGLYSHDELVATAREMCEFEEKAVPLAGAAIELNGESRHGVLSCCLPLPTTSGTPLHIDGCFDLQDSRQDIFQDDSASGKKSKTRVKWNQLLLEHGCAAAAAELLARTAELTETQNYDQWPKVLASASGERLVGELPKSIYESLLSKECIFAGGDSALTRPESVKLADDTISEPVLADGVAIPNPPLPKHVIRGFKATSSPLTAMTPADVRELLRDAEFEDAEYSKSNRECLTDREWLLALLKYCLSDEDYADFYNVPLALMCDGLLRQFDQSDATWLYLGTKPEKSLLWDISDLFLDDEAAKLGLEQLPNVSSLGLDGLIEQLPELFCTLEESESVKCKQGRDDLPSYEWLADFYNHCSDVAEEDGTRSLANHRLTELPLVPDTDGRLWAMGLDSTPVYLPARRQPRWLLDLLAAADISIVSTAGELGKAIARFKSAFGDDEIDSVTPDWLVETAAANSEMLDVLKNDSAVAAKFLAFVTGKELSFNASQRLPELPVFPLVGGGTTALHEEVYQSTGFVPPQISSGVELLFTDNGQLKPLYDKLGVRKLTQARFVLDFVLDGYGALTKDDQLQALCWLKDNYYAIVGSIAEDKRPRFSTKIRTTELIRCDDGELHSASEVYHPECKDVFKLLGSAGHSPDLKLYPTDDWLDFFATIGMERNARPSDLVRAIDCLVEEPLTSKVANSVQRLAKFIETNWEELHDQNVGGNLFSEALSQRRWLPPISTRPPSIPEGLFLAPEERLYAPNELASRGDVDLVSSVLPVCRFPIADPMAGAIGHDAPTAQAVLSQFDNTIEICADYESVGKHEARILKQIYGFIGTELEHPLFPPGEEQLAEKYCNAYCLIDRDFKLWTPNQTFGVPVPYFLHLRQQIRYGNEASERCLNALGRKKSPTADDFRAFFESYHEGCDTDEVPKSDRKQIREAYLHAGRLCEANELSSSLVYSSSGSLRPANEILVDDAPWLSERAKESGIEFLHKELGAKVAVVFGVGQLSQVISEKVEHVEECEDDDLLNICAEINQKIRSPQFAKGLLRLLPFEADIKSEFEALREFEVVPADSIQTVLCWDGEEMEGSEGETEFVFDGNRLYLTAMPDSVLRVHVADAITKQVFGSHTLSNETYVSLILAESTDDIELVLNRLRVPDLPEGRVVAAIEDGDEFVDASTEFEESFEPRAQRRKADPSGNGQSLKSQAASTSSRSQTGSDSTPARTENEPPKVRTGSKKPRSASKSRTHRAVTYVAGEQATGARQSSRETDKRSAVDAAAIERVEQYESQQRVPTVMPHFNKGYDVESRRGESDEIERYIEVKGLGGAWNEFGVKLTPAQIRFGSEKGDSHWLYIVEFALDPDRSVIHVIQNPVKKITDYRFDAGWKQLTVESTGVRSLAPEVASRVQIADYGLGTITKILQRGELMRLTIKMDDDRELKRNYPSKEITVVEE